MKTLWNKQTGEARAYDTVDANEILRKSPDLYTAEDPNPPTKDKDGNLVDKDGNPVGTGPQNVANVENEFRREPVGDDVPAPEREGVIIRNPVTDQPRMAIPAGGLPNAGVAAPGVAPSPADLDAMTVAQLKDYAAANKIDLAGATTKDDIRAAINKAGLQPAGATKK